jgi:hypothetical protein
MVGALRIAALVSVFSVLVLFFSSTSVSDVTSNTGPSSQVEFLEGTRAGGCREGNDSSGDNESEVDDPLNLTYEFTFDVNEWDNPIPVSLTLLWESPWDNESVLEYQVFYGICRCELTYLNSTPGDESYYARDYQTWLNDASEALSIVNRFFIQVTALNKTNDSMSSAVVEILKPYHGWPEIVDVNATPGSGFVGITWEPPYYENVEGPVQYRLWRTLHWIGKGVLLAAVDANTTYFADYEVMFGREMRYTLEALYPDGVIQSDYYSYVVASPWPVDALNGTAEPGFVRLDWEAPYAGPGHTPESYSIYRTTNFYDMLYDIEDISGSFSGSVLQDFHLADIEIGNTTFIDTAIETERSLYYTIVVVYEEGDWGMSNMLMVRPELGTPVMSYITNCMVVGEERWVILGWDTAEANESRPVTAYRIYRGPGEGEEQLIAEVEPSSTGYTDKDVEEERYYYYYVTAVNEMGESEPTDTREVYVDKEVEASNIQAIPEWCLAVSFVLVVIILIFLSGYIIGGRRSVRRFKVQYGIIDQSAAEKEEKGEIKNAEDNGVEVPKTTKMPRRPKGRKELQRQ